MKMLAFLFSILFVTNIFATDYQIDAKFTRDHNNNKMFSAGWFGGEMLIVNLGIDTIRTNLKDHVIADLTKSSHFLIESITNSEKCFVDVLNGSIFFNTSSPISMRFSGKKKDCQVTLNELKQNPIKLIFKNVPLMNSDEDFADEIELTIVEVAQ